MSPALGGPRATLRAALGILLPLFVLAEVNYPNLSPHGQLVVFASLGVALVFLQPRPRPGADDASRWVPLLGAGDWILALLTLGIGGFLLTQTEPVFSSLWLDGAALGERAGAEHAADVAVGFVGLVLVLEAARRALGWVLPALAVTFLLYGRYGASLPDALLPHRGYDWERLVSQTYLHSQGVFGIALQVMLTYVFLFLVFGALLEATGATRFVVGWTHRLFAGSSGAPAKVAVLSSGLLGSLSGSAVANTATTGTFTIPMMRSAGFKPETAAGLEAAASSGGALVPPVMGAGAYMMLEIVDPPVTYLQILQAALLPAVLYYLSLFLIVHFRARRVAVRAAAPSPASDTPPSEIPRPAPGFPFEGVVFAAGLGLLLVFLLGGSSVPRAVTLALGGVLLLSFLSPRTRLKGRELLTVLRKASGAGTALVAAAASVGVVLGVVTLTGLGSRLPALLLPLAQDSLLLALLALMVSSIVLGMGLPSAVCYLLLATLVGPVLGGLGVVPLAAHLFIFYFGMMSMVTPPVALAAYAASSIADSKLLPSAWAAFRFALVGFVLPFLFVYRPQLLLLSPDGGPTPWLDAVLVFALAAAGVVPLAAAMAGWLRGRLSLPLRGVLLAAAFLILAPLHVPGTGPGVVSLWNVAGLLVFGAVWFLRRRAPEPIPV